MSTEQQKKAAQRRKNYVRSRVFGTPERPRLSVFRSNRHLYVQIIDDVAGVTLASAGTLVKGVREQTGSANNVKTAVTIGEAIAKQAMKVGIKAVCFDRNGYKYHGRVKALADAARKTGLAF